MTNSTRMRGTLRSCVLAGHPALAPELERDEVPELLHVEAVVALAAVAEIGDGALHHVGIEEPPVADAARRQVFVHQRGELGAQPPRERDREALLRPLDE